MRRKALIILLVALVLGVIGIGFGLPALERWIMEDSGTGRVGRARIVCLAFGGIITLLAVAVVGSGRRIARFGREAVALGRFPPPTMPVLRTGTAVTGRPALLLGRLYLGLGITLAVLGVTLLALGGYVVVTLWP
jgi:hypothetical protein